MCDLGTRNKPSQWPVSWWAALSCKAGTPGSLDGGLLIRGCELQSLEASQELLWEEMKLQGLEVGLQIVYEIPRAMCYA